MMTAIRRLPAFALCVACLAGCGTTSGSQQGARTTPHARVIRQDDYRGAWPFGPNEGVLRCRRAGSERAVTLEVRGTVYAVNAPAKRRGGQDLRRILVTDHSGMPLDYSTVLEDGLELC
jgi:hypothetical protein